MERKYYNIELDQADATKLSFYLKSNKIYYELSKAFNLYHFEILMNQEEYKKASAYLAAFILKERRRQNGTI